MIELIFVIVIIGTLAAIAVPRFNSMNITAELANGRSDIAAIRSAIITERQRSIVRGGSGYIPNLSTDDTAIILFTGDGTRPLLDFGIRATTGAGGWSINNYTNRTYDFNSGSDITTFTYYPVNTTVAGVVIPAGSFVCVAGVNECDNLTD